LNTAKKADNITDKVKVFIKPPGWFPANLGGFKYAPEIDVLNYKKYDSTYSSKIIRYVSFQFMIALGVGSALLFLNSKLDITQVILIVLFTIATLITCGALLENKSWLKYFEYSRLLLSIVALYSFNQLAIFNTFALVIIIVQTFSIIWFYYLQTTSSHAQ
jgi:hypothetical protein